MKILVVYYSLYGHTFALAQAVAEGAKSIAKVTVEMRHVREFEEIAKAKENDQTFNKLRELQKDIPECTVEDLRGADAVIWGTPTRYGNMSAQLKRLIDSTAELWLQGEMEGKPTAVFTSTASTHGGQETTLVSTMIPLLHLGMIIVGMPYSAPGMIHTEARGGSPYGASTIAGSKGELKPQPEDLEIARALGKRVAVVTLKLRSGPR